MKTRRKRRKLKRAKPRSKEPEIPVEKANPKPTDLGDARKLKYFFWINVIRIVCEILADQLHNL